MEDIKKKFIVDENLEQKKIESYVNRLLPFCKITTKGAIQVEDKVSTALKRVKIALVGRFLANKLEPSIAAEMTAEELATCLSIPKDQIYARVKDLRKSNFLTKPDKNKYRVNPLVIGKFLDELEKDYGVVKK
jgi:hypothetical protein